MKASVLTIMISAMAAVQVHAALVAGTPAGAPYAGRVAIGEYGLGADYPIRQARPFSMGSTAYYLNSISFGSHLYWENGAGNIAISLYTDNGGIPGSAVAGGQNLFSATSATIGQTLLPASTLTLEANATYWFVTSVDQTPGATRYWWDLTDSAAFDSDVPGTDLPLIRANDALGWATYSESSMQMSIYGSVVPEPGSLTLIGVGAGGAWLARRKRLKRMRVKQTSGFEELVYIPSFLEEERSGTPLVSDIW